MKTLKAWLSGYFLFYVNDRKFLMYHRAVNCRKQTTGGINFVGWNVGYFFFSPFGPWRCFYYRTGAIVKQAGLKSHGRNNTNVVSE
jgi:hypothetical protein